MTTFLSTYLNKVDRKSRVSIPAPFRAVLAANSFLAYGSLTDPSIEAFGRDSLDQVNRRRFEKGVAEGEFERLLLGGGDGVIETIMALVSEITFDGEGRVVLPKSLIDHAGIGDSAVFVGRGNRFQIWAPERFADHQRQAVAELRARLNGGSNVGQRA